LREISSTSRCCVQEAPGGKVHNEELTIALFTKDCWKDQEDECKMSGTTGL